MLLHTAAYQRPCPSRVIASNPRVFRSSPTGQLLVNERRALTPRQHQSRVLTVHCMTDPKANANQRAKCLFVCLGNICRSPTAEAVFTTVAERRGVADAMTIDSCGTGGGSSDWYREGGFSYHEGDAADARMRDHAARRGIRLTSRSRPLTPQDLHTFDYIVAMDDANVQAIVTAAEYWRKKHDVPADYRTKVVKMCSYLQASGSFANKYDSVPDPYYGGAAGFELVLDLLEDACEGLLDHIESTRGLAGN